VDDHFNGKTYADVLQVIGTQLDSQDFHDIMLAEVADGFIGRASRAGAGLPMESLSYGFEELPLKDEAAQDPVDGHMHYRILLGALGHEVDRMGARMIMVMELSIGVLVTFYPAGYHLEGCYGDRYEILYKAEQLQNLLSLAATR
jgi:hypothetical protein